MRCLLPSLFWAVLAPFAALAAERRPNVVFILADDLGYGDLGAAFQNARRAQGDRTAPWHQTPHLDQLAAEGMRLPQHYCSAPVCAPSRASLLLGVHQGHANVRDNQFDKALENNHTLGSVLRGAGYATAAIGKWGLQGGPGERSVESAKATPAAWPAYPTKRGFDFFFGYARHQDGHWHYPHEDGRQVWENERELSATLAGCYTTDLFTARAKKWISDQHAAQPEQPFFLYLAYDTPHAKLQLPPGPYPSGGGEKGGVQWLGTSGAAINTAGGKIDSFVHPEYAAATWDHDHNSATAEQAWPDVYRRYATDVRRIDDGVGDLLALLRDLGLERDTLVVFTTDNGPSRESYLPGANYEPTFFGSYGPFEGIKRDVWEGGLRVGAIAHWPAQIAAGQVNQTPSMFHDWLPTLAEIAGVPAPARADGVSLVPTLTGRGWQKPATVYTEYFEKGQTPPFDEFAPSRRGRVRQQMQAIRAGDFMGVRYRIQSHADPFEIYYLPSDPQQRKNVAAEHEELQQQMHDTVLRLRSPDPSAIRPYDSELVPALAGIEAEPGLEWRVYGGSTPWLARLDDLTPAASGIGLAPGSAVAREQTTALLFSGYLRAPADGEYSFALPAQTIGLLRLHEVTVIDAGLAAGATDAAGKIKLQAGLHRFRLYCQPGTSAASLGGLEWGGPGVARQPLPAHVFSHAGNRRVARPPFR